jgi:hypothetical protein
MKSKITKFAIAMCAFLAFTSCGDDDSTTPIADVPTAAQFNALLDSALENQTQHFSFDAEDGFMTFTSEKGVIIMLNGNCLELNGMAVTGNVDIEFVEIFDGGTMAATNKTTMGRMPNNDLALLISDGEFYINATKNGQQLDMTCNYNLLVPTTITDGFDPLMTLWQGTVDNDGDLVWDEVNDPTGQGGVGQEGNNYYLTFGEFGWCNIDRFYSDPRPKTTILADAPEGYDNENSTIYVSFDGEPGSLARLDTYTAEGYFSEHYGQIPIGLECHIIFVTEEDGQYRYAIKAETIEEDEIITFTFAETITGTEAQLVAAINAVQD